MNILVTGANGQLGNEMRLLAATGSCPGPDARFIFTDINQASEEAVAMLRRLAGGAAVDTSTRALDITDPDAVHAMLVEEAVDIIVNCAAFTNVDAAETQAELAERLNARAPEILACEMRRSGGLLVHISTDYVFDGQGERPWEPDDKCYAPLNVYGQSKLDGELAVSSILDKYFIVRIAWVFGLNGKNFIKTMINVGKTHDTVRVVNDQIGTPTYTLDLARLLVDMVETEKYGYYHATNEGGYISWYDFCCEFYKQYGLTTTVIPVSTAEYGLSVAARPFNSRLDKSKLVEAGFTPLPDWKDAVRRYLTEAEL